jgi:AcrR family transcriptional regulator
VTTPARVRSDAARNSGRVLEAARQVFAEKGTGAGVDEVAARAGVGKATVYRCWPSKDALLAAVAGARVAWFTDLVLQAHDAADPWEAFCELLRAAAQSQAENALLTAGLGALAETDELQARREGYRAALQELMDRAARQGQLRPDATAREVTVLFCGAARVLDEEGERDPAVWRRYAELVADAVRA